MTTEHWEAKRAEFLSLAGAVFDQMLGPDEQEDLVSFAQREQRACELTDALARWLMTEHVAQEPAEPAAVESLCPLCQGPLQDVSESVGPVVRELMTRRGKITFPRRAVRCRRCRKLFFPAG